MSSFPAISLSLVTLKMGVSVRLNGFDVLASASARPTAARIDCRPFMLPGENRLVATAESLPDDALEGEAGAELSLVSGDLESEKTTTNILAQTEVSPAITRLQPDAPTVILAHAFHVAADTAPWSFVRADPLEISDRSGTVDQACESQAHAILRSLRDAIASRNVKHLVAMFAHALSETASATGTPRSAVEDAFVAHWTDIVTEDDLRVREARVMMEPGLAFRVLHARGPLGRPPIVVDTRASSHTVGLALARVDGQLRIVR